MRFMIAAWSAMKLTGPRTMSRLPMRILWINWRNGKSWRNCQTKFGSARIAATSIPNHNQPLLKIDARDRKGFDEYAEHKKSDGIFGLKPNPGEHTEPKPISNSPQLIARTTHQAAIRKAAQRRSS